MDRTRLTNNLHALFCDQLERVECFGGAAAVLQNGEVVFSESFGDARFTENSLYRLASVTKLLTATAILRLQEAGKLCINDPVSTYLPDFAHLSLGALSQSGQVYATFRPSREVTLFDLLTHTAGIGAAELGNREYALLPREAQTTLASAVDYYGKHFHLAFEPGTQYAYSGFAGYDILARVAELVTGKRFGAYLTESVTSPLGMRDTTFQPTEEQYARLVPMHKRIGGEDREIDFHGTLYRGVPRSYEMAGASLISSLHDMTRFAKMLLNGGRLDGAELLAPQTVAAMLAPALPDSLDGLSRGENAGLGCFPITGQHRLPRGTVMSHGAYGTHLLLFPEKNAAAIFLKNSYFDMSITSRATLAFERAVLDALGEP